MIPQIIILAILTYGLGHDAAMDGKPKTGKHSFGWALLGTVIVLGLLNWGGFFDVLVRR